MANLVTSKIFVINDEIWREADLVVDTRNWWPGERVLVEPTLVKSIDWDDRGIRLAPSREQIEHWPANKGKLPIEEPLSGHARTPSRGVVATSTTDVVKHTETNHIAAILWFAVRNTGRNGPLFAQFENHLQL
jgi:hypothetical protein